MQYIPSYSGTLTRATAEKIRDLLAAVFEHPCSCVDVVQSMDQTHIRTSCRVTKDSNGSTVRLVEHEDRVGLHWSIGGYATSIYEDERNPVRVTWMDGALSIRHNAPAGHPLLWIYAPEDDYDAREEIAEVCRRHEADAAELEKCRENLRAEIRATIMAEELVDKLVDALEEARRVLTFNCGVPGNHPSVMTIEDALVVAGRIYHG